MKKKLDDHGFALMEILVVVMILTCMALIFYGIAVMRHHMASGRIRENEAYYAAVSAVRMMAGEVAEGSTEWTLGNGIERTRTEITFISDDEYREVVSIPIEVWSERNGEELLLSAESAYGRKTKKVTLKLKQESVVQEISVKDDLEMATASNAILEEKTVWKPIGYRIEG